MTSVEDLRFVAVCFGIGALCALAHLPFAVAISGGVALAVAIVPYFLFSATLSLPRALRPSAFRTARDVLMGRSNLPERKVRLLVAALIVGGALYGLAGQVMTELLMQRVLGLATAAHPAGSIIVLSFGLLVMFWGIRFLARRDARRA
ncbi:hypothetical protein [Primorskyibacter sp. S187A]|uniref:hypothetical protein n=1 Tax=Primorskyibacter sp. S187A TaxID=3415130 RepID=UPI003C7E8216